MHQVGFEPLIPVSERAKTVHALDRADTVIGYGKNKGDANPDDLSHPVWRASSLRLRLRKSGD
jgi:hypothetical protein